jgi:hypothetical protein
VVSRELPEIPEAVAAARALAGAFERYEATYDALEEAVRRARAVGVTWDTIASLTGAPTRQAAHRTWRHVLEGSGEVDAKDVPDRRPPPAAEADDGEFDGLV